MSDQSWGQPPQGPGPQWGQPQPGYGGQPQYGQQPPQSGQSYGQPQYGAQQQYGPQGPYGPPPQGGGSKKGLFAVLGVVVVAGIVVLALFLTGVFGSDDSSDGGTPEAAVRTLLDAGKSGDLEAGKAVLCDRDRGDGRLIGELTRNKVTSYTIERTEKRDDDHVVVYAKVTVAGENPGSDDIPVVRESGTWRVCFSDPASGSSDAPETLRPSAAVPGGNSGSYRLPSPGSTYTLPNGSTITIPSLPALPTAGSTP